MKLSLLHTLKEAPGDTNYVKGQGDASNQEYIDPNTFFGRKGAVTFIYTKAGQLYLTTDPSDNHADLIMKDSHLFDYYQRITGIIGNPDAIRKSGVEKHDITGRIGILGKNQYCSIWNFDDNVVKNLMKPCLEGLIRKRVLKPDAIVTTPITPNITAQEWITSGFPEVKEVSDDEKERLELIKKLHTMTSPQKAAAMKKLGLGGGFGSEKVTPWTRARDMGVIVPGVKSWAPTSESVD